MSINPKLNVDWNSAEGRIDLGERFNEQNNIFKVDVLSDWHGQLTELLAAAKEELYPGLADAIRLEENQARRIECEALAGFFIERATVVPTGHICLELSGGRVLVVAARGPVQLVEVPAVEGVIRAADAAFSGDFYLEEAPGSNEKEAF